MLSVRKIALEFIELFPQNKVDYEAHVEDYSKLLGHVFFGDVINIPFTYFLKSGANEEKNKKYANFIEHMLNDGNDRVKDIVYATILEYLGDDEAVLRNAYNYFSDRLVDVSAQVEKIIGRREVIISYENGKRCVEFKNLIPRVK